MIQYTTVYGEHCPNFDSIEKITKTVCDKCAYKERSTNQIVICRQKLSDWTKEDEISYNAIYNHLIEVSNSTTLKTNITYWKNLAEWLKHKINICFPPPPEITEENKLKEPKFNVDDWIISNKKDIDLLTNLMRVTKIEGAYYKCMSQLGLFSYFGNFIDENYHLWSIKDAKPGDLLVYPDGTFAIFKKHLKEGFYLALAVIENYNSCSPNVRINQSCIVKNVQPTTKEQYESLSEHLEVIGYKLDRNKARLYKLIT